jgi:hypothetical protein
MFPARSNWQLERLHISGPSALDRFSFLGRRLPILIRDFTNIRISIYLFWKYTASMRSRGSVARKILIMFIMIGLFVLSTHILILSMAFSNRHLVVVVTQPLSYAVKTKIEFLILNCLVEFSNGRMVGAVASNDFTFQHEDNNRGHEPEIGSIRKTKPESLLKQAEIRDRSMGTASAQLQQPPFRQRLQA